MCGPFSEIDFNYIYFIWAILYSPLCVILPILYSYASTLIIDVRDFYYLFTLCIGAGINKVCVYVGFTTLGIFVAFDLKIFARLAKVDWCWYFILCKGKYLCGA